MLWKEWFVFWILLHFCHFNSIFNSLCYLIMQWRTHYSPSTAKALSYNAQNLQLGAFYNELILFSVSLIWILFGMDCKQMHDSCIINELSCLSGTWLLQRATTAFQVSCILSLLWKATQLLASINRAEMNVNI